MTSAESSVYSEIYCYKVIYPNGTFIRVSPDLKAAKTGDILECGSVFESSKSLFLDGINYVKLADGRGWVFHSKGETKVLELIEVIKKYEETPILPPSSSCENLDFQPRTPTYSRNKNLYWREVRSKVRCCTNFHEFSELVRNGMPSLPMNGSTRSSSVSDSPSEQLIRKQLCLITSTTRKGAELISNIKDLEAHLWVLVHMGGQVNHVMQLTVDEANFYFEKISSARRNELLSIALEIGAATRVHNTELAKCADILADDVRNFVQRYVIIHSLADDSHVTLTVSAPSAKSSSKSHTGTDSRTVVSPQGKGSPVASLKKEAAFPAPPSTPTLSSSNGSSRGHGATPNSQSGTWLSSWVCTPPPPAMPEPECREMTEMSPHSSRNTPRKVPPPPAPTSIFTDMSNYVWKITSDPEFQFAGLI